LNTVESPLGYVVCLLNVSFDVLSVIRRLHNLWSPFKIPFYSVPPIVFWFRANAFFTWGPYSYFHEIALTCHIEGSMITAIWTHLRMFQNCTSSCQMLNSAYASARGRGGSLHLIVSSTTTLNHTEPATFSILPCWNFFGDSYFLYFILEDASNIK
jgi:hypothetical protein